MTEPIDKGDQQNSFDEDELEDLQAEILRQGRDSDAVGEQIDAIAE